MGGVGATAPIRSVSLARHEARRVGLARARAGSESSLHGLLDEGATISSAKNPRCRLETVEGPGARFVCTWDA